MQQQPTSLKSRILHGAAWVLGADLLSRIIRQGINLVLTRLIVPEAFGLIVLSRGYALVCVVFGQPLIDRFYGQPYAEAGRMLPVLAIGLLGRTLCITYKDLLIVRGQTFTLMVLTLMHVSTQLGALWLGFQWGGYPAAIRGMAVADWFTCIAYAVCFARLSLWQRELDLPIAAIAMGLAITTSFNWF